MEKKLFDIAKNIEDFALKFGNINMKSKQIDVKDFLNTEVSDKYRISYLERFVNSNLKLLFEDLFKDIKNMPKEERDEILLFMSLSAYNQDWDYVFNTVKDYRGQKYLTWHNDKNEEIYPFQVKSWGNVQQNYDINFLNQIRNGIAHSKFNYNPETKTVTIIRNNGEFVVDVLTDYLLYLPYHIWDINEQSPSKENQQSVVVLRNGTLKECLMLELINQEPNTKNINEKLKKLGLTDDQTSLICSIADICLNSNNYPLVNKINTVHKVLEEINKNNRLGKNYIEAMKLVYERFGITIEKEQTFDLEKIYEDNELILLFISNMLLSKNISKEEKNLIILRILNSKFSEQSKNFFANNAISRFLLNIEPDVSWKEFRKKLKEGYLPYTIEDVSFFIDKAYFNYVFNYLVEKGKDLNEYIKVDEVLKNISATDYFETNEFTQDLSLNRTMGYIRNCIVHPRFLKREGKDFILSDYNKKGELVFSAKIDRTKFFNLANLVVENLKNERFINKEELDEFCEEQIEKC